MIEIETQVGNLCANCCEFIRNERDLKSSQVKALLSLMFKLDYLNKLNFNAFLLEEEDDPVKLCGECSKIFKGLNKLYDQFNHRRHLESYLACRINILDEIILQLHKQVNGLQDEEEQLKSQLNHHHHDYSCMDSFEPSIDNDDDYDDCQDYKYSKGSTPPPPQLDKYPKTSTPPPQLDKGQKKSPKKSTPLPKLDKGQKKSPKKSTPSPPLQFEKGQKKLSQKSSSPPQFDKGPWVKIGRLTPEEIKAYQPPLANLTEDDLNINQEVEVPCDDDYISDKDDDFHPDSISMSDNSDDDDHHQQLTNEACKRTKTTKGAGKSISARSKKLTKAEREESPVFELDPSQPTSTCPVCSKNYPTADGLYVHLQTRHMPLDNSTTCLICSTSLRSVCNLTKHLRSHAGLPYFPCTYDNCGKVYKHRTHLVEHTFKCHRSGPQGYHCDLCPEGFPNRKAVALHKKLNHRTHFCHCGRSYVTPEQLERHMKSHELKRKRYRERTSCPTCKQKYVNLDAHLPNCHPQRFNCPICDKRFSTMSLVRQHQLSHNNIRKFLCVHCGLAFKENGVLVRHIRTHTGEKPFACHLCPRRFCQKGNLGSHLIFHSGQKLHLCTVCGMSLTTSTGLKRHMQCHTGDLPHKCTICDAAFPDRRPLLKHLKTHEEEEKTEETTN